MAIPLTERMSLTSERAKRMRENETFSYMKNLDGLSGADTQIDGREM